MWIEAYEAEDGPKFVQVYLNANAGTRKAAQECDNVSWWHIHC